MTVLTTWAASISVWAVTRSCRASDGEASQFASVSPAERPAGRQMASGILA
jgi:hypothetical protein